MAMINMEILHIIMEIYEELLNTVILKNIPKDCPNIDEIKDNYLGYLFENYKSRKPTEDKESVKIFIISQQKELWADEDPYNILRSFVYDENYDRLVHLSTLSFRLAHISHEYDELILSKEKRDKALWGITEYTKRVKPCFKDVANEIATEGYKDIMYASGDRKEISERLKETIEMEKN